MSKKDELKKVVELIKAFEKQQNIEILNWDNINKELNKQEPQTFEPIEEEPKEKIRMEVQQRLQELEKIFNKLLEHY